MVFRGRKRRKGRGWGVVSLQVVQLIEAVVEEREGECEVVFRLVLGFGGLFRK